MWDHDGGRDTRGPREAAVPEASVREDERTVASDSYSSMKGKPRFQRGTRGIEIRTGTDNWRYGTIEAS